MVEGRTSLLSVAWIRSVLGLRDPAAPPAPAAEPSLAPPPALLRGPEPGLVLGRRYLLEQRIGQGAVSVVYRGRDQMLDLGVAIKILLFPPGGGLRPAAADLRAEAKAAMRLSHPNIVRVYHVDQDRGLEYLVMELVDGEDLGRLRARYPGHRLPLAVVVKAGLGLLSALDHAHGLGVIHNDIKPANLLLDVDGTIKLCDLAFARLTERAMPPGALPGVPAYTAPERILGQVGGVRSDLYAAGATLFALAAGMPPYGREAKAAAEGHLHGVMPHSSAIPPRLDAVLRRAMARDPMARFATAQAMRHELLRFAEELENLIQIQPQSIRPVVADELPSSPSLSRTAMVSLTATVNPLPAPVVNIAAPPPPPPPPVKPAADLAPIGSRLVVINGRTLEVGPFWMEPTPVTNLAYKAFLEESGEAPPAHWLGRRPPEGKGDHPVVGVSFAAAQRYAAHRGRRLPTEAEWVAAARGPEDQPFPWGEQCEPARCQCSRAGATDTAPVGAHPGSATAEGVRDLLGQVWEWVAADPHLPAPEAGRAIALGGSFRHACQTAGVVPRTEIIEGNAYLYLGFRCAWSPP